jgi:hypothetical protein
MIREFRLADWVTLWNAAAGVGAPRAMMTEVAALVRTRL